MEYKVNLEKFSGPLDVLLSLIEEKKLAVNDISLSQVTDQFLEYLNKLSPFGESPGEGQDNAAPENLASAEYPRILADFLVVASRLILIKSYSLLPNLVLSAEEEEGIKDLQMRLKAYREIKMTAKMLGKWAKNRPSYFSKEFYFNFPAAFYPPKNITIGDLKNIYALFLKTLPQIEKLEEQSIKKIVTIEEKIQELTARIGAAAEASFADISGGVKSKIDIILNFLALLMLFRGRILEASQDKLFGDIKIKQYQNS